MKLLEALQKADWYEIAEHLSFYCDEQLLHHFEGFHKQMLTRKPLYYTEPLLHIRIEHLETEGKFDVFGIAPDDPRSYTLAFSLWEEWLFYEIDSKTLSTFSYSEIIAHCYWEMSYNGFKEEELLLARKQLVELKDIIDNPPYEEERITCLFCSGSKQTKDYEICTTCDENGYITVIHRD